jgi:hypothetical protein
MRSVIKKSGMARCPSIAQNGFADCSLSVIMVARLHCQVLFGCLQRWTDHKKRPFGNGRPLAVFRAHRPRARYKKRQNRLGQSPRPKGRVTAPAKGPGSATYANKSYNQLLGQVPSRKLVDFHYVWYTAEK